MKLPKRVTDKFTVKANGCWVWQASKTDGYGQIRWEGRLWQAHRLVYTLLVGPIPEGLQLDHLCRNRACVNPAHLEPVTQQENIRRGDGGKHHRGKTHCPQDHEYTEKNTYVTPKGSRMCRICMLVQSREGQRRFRAITTRPN